MEFQRINDKLTVRPIRDFNLLTVRSIQPRMNGITHLVVDLRRSKIVDSEALIYLFKLSNSGVVITLLQPPPVYFEALRILELDRSSQFRRINVVRRKSARVSRIRVRNKINGVDGTSAI